jgi:hypothetical protein
MENEGSVSIFHFPFSIFRFPFSVFRCFRAGFCLVGFAPKLLKISDFWCKVLLIDALAQADSFFTFEVENKSACGRFTRV